MSNSFTTPWAVACQAPLSMGFPRQEYWSGLPFPFPGDFPNLGVVPASPALADGFFTVEPPGKIYISYPYTHIYTHTYTHTHIICKLYFHLRWKRSGHI